MQYIQGCVAMHMSLLSLNTAVHKYCRIASAVNYSLQPVRPSANVFHNQHYLFIVVHDIMITARML